MVDVLVGGASHRAPMSYEEFLSLGETKHHEYYEGLCVVNPPTRRHSRAVKQLERILDPACPHTHEVLIGWGWETAPREQFEPDLMVSDRSSPDNVILRAPPPMLVVEVSSPSTRSDDWGGKRAAYAHAGAGWYWIVDLDLPEVVVLRSSGDSFVEAARLRQRGTTPGPLVVELDPSALAQV
ncbi:MAG: Uma2 family endonuclease [Acidimicrobiales bacterium]